MTVGMIGRRPMIETFRRGQNEFLRGMKVRTSVKKLCDGCKVSGDRYLGSAISSLYHHASLRGLSCLWTCLRRLSI